MQRNSRKEKYPSSLVCVADCYRFILLFFFTFFFYSFSVEHLSSFLSTQVEFFHTGSFSVEHLSSFLSTQVEFFPLGVRRREFVYKQYRNANAKVIMQGRAMRNQEVECVHRRNRKQQTRR